MTRIAHLEFPVNLGAENDATGTIAKLTIKRPKVGDILATSKLAETEDERRVHAVARMCKQLPSLIEQLYASDWERVNDAYDELRFPERSGATLEES
ncbi:MAG: phage tail assembly protein [Lentisphaerae bacterium]|nr:phage tail assembly protein [Lentisphaerota bacterium]